MGQTTAKGRKQEVWDHTIPLPMGVTVRVAGSSLNLIRAEDCPRGMLADAEYGHPQTSPSLKGLLATFTIPNRANTTILFVATTVVNLSH